MLAWQREEGKGGARLKCDASGPGLFRGEGLFETVLMRGRIVYAWENHWKRLSAGAEKLGIDLPEKDHTLALLSQFFDVEGVSDDGSPRRLRVTALMEGLFFGTVVLGEFPEHEVLLNSPFCRNERSPLAGLKAVSYAENMLVLAEAKARGGTEALLANTKGDCCEGAWSNVFVVKDGVLFTPSLSSGCLPGVTRGLLIELALEQGVEVKEVVRPLSWFNDCDEMFLTSSLRGVRAVARFEEGIFPQGPVTKFLKEAYEGQLSQLGLLL